MIDTGFHRQECFSALLDGMRGLRLEPEKTDVFLTHLHSDHCGNAGMLQKMGCRLLMGKIDYKLAISEIHNGWQSFRDSVIGEGMPAETVKLFFENNPAALYGPEYFTVDYVTDGDVLQYGGYQLQVIAMPGHTPGQLCLYESNKKILFSADHILFDITPNITFWPTMEDALKIYLDGLRKIDAYEVKLALPSHLNLGEINIHERTAQLISYHETRLVELERIIQQNSGLTGYAIAGQMTWRIRARNFEELSLAQKWFGFSETLSHLEYLCKRGKIRREQRNGEKLYFKI